MIAPNEAVAMQCITAENNVLTTTMNNQSIGVVPYERKYMKFSVIPKPSPTAPPYTTPSTIPSNLLLSAITRRNTPFVASSTMGATMTAPERSSSSLGSPSATDIIRVASGIWKIMLPMIARTIAPVLPQKKHKRTIQKGSRSFLSSHQMMTIYVTIGTTAATSDAKAKKSSIIYCFKL